MGFSERGMRTREAVDLRLTAARARRSLFLEYAQDQLRARDHHGVADAAMDLREIEQEIDTLKWVLEIDT